MKRNYRIGGHPNASECNGFWKHSESDTADSTTFEAQMLSLEKWIEESGVVRLGEDLYHRGDFLYDWTHYIEICNAACLSRKTLEMLQAWLRSPENAHARIVIPTNTDMGDEAVIMIYPEAVRLGASLEGDLEEALAVIRSRMK